MGASLISFTSFGTSRLASAADNALAIGEGIAGLGPLSGEVFGGCWGCGGANRGASVLI